MADNEDKNSEVQMTAAPDQGLDLAKLKELEASLAKELDQRVRLTEVSDPRLEGSVQVNPSMEDALKRAKEQSQLKIISGDANSVQAVTSRPAAQASAAGATQDGSPTPAETSPTPAPGAAPAQAQPFGKNPDEISLTEVDELLNQFDEGFSQNLSEIGKEVKAIEAPGNLESIPIGSDYLKEANKDIEAIEAEEPPPVEAVTQLQPTKFWPALRHLMKTVATTPVEIMRRLVDPLLAFRRQPPQESLNLVKLSVTLPLHALAVEVRNFWNLLRSYPRRTYYLVAALILVSSVILWLAHDITSNFRSDKEKDPFLRNFNEVADSIQVIPENAEGEDVESPLRHPEYIVHFQRIVANLKPENPRMAPMVAAELYIEASNQDCAVEIHDRQTEVRDIIERVLEESTFADLDTKEGKSRLKVRIRMALNRILNKGNAKGIYFKEFNIHE